MRAQPSTSADIVISNLNQGAIVTAQNGAKFSIGYQGEGDYLAKVSDKFIMVDDEKQLKSGLSEFTYFIEKAGTQK